jgi:hypothetical protein
MITVTRPLGEKAAEKRLAVERGRVVWASTNLTNEKLGRLLMELGWLPLHRLRAGAPGAGLRC